MEKENKKATASEKLNEGSCQFEFLKLIMIFF